MQNTTWRVGNGMLIKFWTDCWVTNCGPLINYVVGNIPSSEVANFIGDYVTDSHSWNMEKFGHLLPTAQAN